MEPPWARPDEPGAFAAETYFSGCVVWCDVPREPLVRTLPPGVVLGSVPGHRRDRHPAVFIFGEHQRSAVLFATMRFPTGVRFHEMVIGVPFVCRSGDAEPALFLPLVFSGDAVATWSGNVHYGYTKRRVPMEWLGHSFVVTDEHGAILAQASVEAKDEWSDPASSRLPAVAAAVALGRMPVLGRLDDGRMVRSRFGWTLTASRVRAIAARVCLAPRLAAILGTSTAHGIPARCVEVAGLRWRISWPNA